MNAPAPSRLRAARFGLSLLPRLIAALPQRGRLALGRFTGWLMARLLRKRRDVMRANVAVAFPEWNQAAREALIENHFKRLGEGICEGFWGWFGNLERVPEYRIIGLKHLEAAEARGQGVILNAAHVADMELGVYFVSRHAAIHAVYRPNNNPAIDSLINQGREKHLAGLIPRDDTRSMVRALRGGGVLWTAPDQNYHGKTSAFIPFLGLPAATNTAMPTLARMGRATILPYHVRRFGTRYELEIEPPLDGIPSGDDAADTRRLVERLEAEIRRHPEMYLWGHRRFKTLPEGYPPLY
ncbi:lipid A biosynthesis acyltransferase [Guyparkeria hydrothermalis]|uniref:lysophospholipid acyltransferase family protein n=1 Tax=Guyparkeria hydrothermalis TaxID=923 RepID=UPI002020DDCA|nr:lipid A biosynthesis acyltransferase [Guyparkeria hydrothermalis]MCL7744776.1 lipid A biosynthesis acyltransferase [Guyparkeria hydrothermalis]